MENRRAYPRIPESLRVTLTIESAPDAPEIEGRTYECRTSEISLRGARLAADLSLPVNTRFQIAVVLAGDDKTYRHQGRAVWCRTQSTPSREDGDHYLIGIEFNLSPGPQLDAWRTAILHMFERV